MRSIEELTASALAVIDRAFTTPAIHYVSRGKRHLPKEIPKYAERMFPLFSGGHDSLVACHLASQHPRFERRVHHINTGIGAAATRVFVDEVCRELGWELAVYKSDNTYEQFVRDRGFPGPGMHQWVYLRIKDRCIRQMVKGRRIALITGCRRQESARRMGHVEPLKIGQIEKRNTPTGEIERHVEKNRYWSAPCFDWSSEEQLAYMEHHDLPKSPMKLAMGMSGECSCGSFASPGELARLRVHAPDVAAEIDRLAAIAKSLGKHCVWGTRPPGQKGIVTAQTGPLCNSCDLRAAAAGILIDSSCAIREDEKP